MQKQCIMVANIVLVFNYLQDGFCDHNSFKEKNCKKELCECTHRVKIKLGEVVEMVLVDEGKHMDNNHPMHMHGYNFRVVAMEKVHCKH